MSDDPVKQKLLEIGATVEAAWDGRTFSALSRGDKKRYCDRLEAAVDAMAADISKAQSPTPSNETRHGGV